MPSEKMRYFKTYPAAEKLAASGLIDKANNKLTDCSTGNLSGLIENLLDYDSNNNYSLVTHLLELNAEELEILLQAVIEKEKESGSISEDAERLIEHILSCLSKR